LSKSVMIGVPVKNAARWLPTSLDIIERFTYPKEDLRVVFEYSKSSDDTLKILKKYLKRTRIQAEIYQEPYDPALRKLGIQMGAVIYNDFQTLLDEDYFMLFDCDICDAPRDLIERLMSIGEDIVAPYPWNEGYSHFYDTWIFRIGNKRFHPLAPPGIGMSTPIEVDSVGTCFLSTREAFRDTPILNPYPNLSYCNNARRRGYRVLAVPYVEVFHRDLAGMGIVHNPLPPKMGGYPASSWATALDPVIDLDGNIVTPYSFNFSDKVEIQRVEREVALRAIKQYFTTPFCKERGKSLRWMYNLSHFGAFWMTRDPQLLDLMYRNEMYPSYIEIELTNKCPYKCVHCERTHWGDDIELRNMTWDEFLLIMRSFPNLKQCSFTGIGDPWLNPIFLDAIKYVKERDVYFEQYDTFQHWSRDSIEKMVEWGVERLFVSLDAATKETYEKVRKGHSWDRMIRNVKLFDEIKKEHGSVYPEINFHFVIDALNIHEALDCVDFVKSLDIDNGFIQYSRLLHMYPEINDLYVDIPEDLCDKIRRKGRDEGIPIAWNADVNPNLPPMSKCAALFQPFFFANGDVIVCCAQHEGNRRKWEQSMRMGNIFEAKDFKKIWYGERYRRLRRELREGVCPEPCVGCPIYKQPSEVRMW